MEFRQGALEVAHGVVAVNDFFAALKIAALPRGLKKVFSDHVENK